MIEVIYVKDLACVGVFHRFSLVLFRIFDTVHQQIFIMQFAVMCNILHLFSR